MNAYFYRAQGEFTRARHLQENEASMGKYHKVVNSDGFAMHPREMTSDHLLHAIKLFEARYAREYGFLQNRVRSVAYQAITENAIGLSIREKHLYRKLKGSTYTLVLKESRRRGIIH